MGHEGSGHGHSTAILEDNMLLSIFAEELIGLRHGLPLDVDALDSHTARPRIVARMRALKNFPLLSAASISAQTFGVTPA